VVSLLLTLVIDIGLSVVIFSVLTHRGVAPGIAYLVAGLAPVLGMVINWVRTRKLGGVSVIVLVTLVISALVTLIGSQDVRILLLKDAVLTGGFGLVTLVSALPFFRKPLMFAYGLKFATDGSREGVQEWYALWDRYAGFRHSQYVINNTWGIAYLVEAATKVAAAYLLPYTAAYAVNQIMPWVVLAALIFWTISYGKKQREAGARRAEASAAEASAAEASAAEASAAEAGAADAHATGAGAATGVGPS
jgi:intracellular septation protein A